MPDSCNCASFGSARHCPVHTQADYDAQQGRNLGPDDEVAIVFTARIQVQGEYVDVPETMHTPFQGPSARARAESFLASEKERDFTEDLGWRWFIWASPRANAVYGEELTDAMLGPDE